MDLQVQEVDLQVDRREVPQDLQVQEVEDPSFEGRQAQVDRRVWDHVVDHQAAPDHVIPETLEGGLREDPVHRVLSLALGLWD